MRTLIISDIHANLTAFHAVLQHAEAFDRVWCLGDVVGYGPDPNGCIEKLKSLPDLKCVRGNHDAAILGEIDIKAFNDEARKSLEWLESRLTSRNRRWLEALPERIEVDGITLAHGSPRNPVWEYVMELGIAQRNMDAFDTRICLVGHTHIPSIFTMNGGTPETTQLHIAQPDDHFIVERKSIMNPGSVGQPRDHNPNASYLIYDDDQEKPWVYHRAAYDVEEVQKRIIAAGLPHRHATRLEVGW